MKTHPICVVLAGTASRPLSSRSVEALRTMGSGQVGRKLILVKFQRKIGVDIVAR